MKKPRLFRDHPDGLCLHAGKFRGHDLWHSEDGGNTWWCGHLFSGDAKVTLDELIEMAVGILRDAPRTAPWPEQTARKKRSSEKTKGL
jgi:hypothetical protein